LFLLGLIADYLVHSAHVVEQNHDKSQAAGGRVGFSLDAAVGLESGPVFKYQFVEMHHALDLVFLWLGGVQYLEVICKRKIEHDDKEARRAHVVALGYPDGVRVGESVIVGCVGSPLDFSGMVDILLVVGRGIVIVILADFDVLVSRDSSSLVSSSVFVWAGKLLVAVLVQRIALLGIADASVQCAVITRTPNLDRYTGSSVVFPKSQCFLE